MHARLRQALELVRAGLDASVGGGTVDDLLLHCRGFCAALSTHHSAEDAVLFPAIVAAHPHLAPTLARLTQDHSMLERLLTALRAAADRSASDDELARHLEGIEAIMASHFGFEERALAEVLETLDLERDATAVLGPLAR